MLRNSFLRVAAVAAGCLLSAGGASAQNYDGATLLKFGVFTGGTFIDANSTGGVTASTSMDSAVFGLSAGYDHLFAGGFVLGAEADVSLGDLAGRISGTKLTTPYMATLRARLGVHASPDVLVYATGGLGWIGLELGASALSSTASDTSETQIGYTLGGGAEFDVRDPLGTLVFAEYLYADFDAWTRPPGLAHGIDTDAHIIRVGVKFKTGNFHRPEDYRPFDDSGMK